MFQNSKIPDIISDDEKLLRIIFHPIYVTKDEKSVNSKAFRSSHSTDEVSVTRIFYSTSDICKKQALKMRRANDTYYGFAIIDTSEVRELGAYIFYSPTKNNKAHADIKIGYVCKKGEPLPQRYSFNVETDGKKSTFIQRP